MARLPDGGAHDHRGLARPDCLCRAVETVTTVGYGDLYPVTDAGRVIAMIVMLTGIGFVALLTGSIAQRFLMDAPPDAPEVAREDEILRLLNDISSRLATVEAEQARRPPDAGSGTVA